MLKNDVFLTLIGFSAKNGKIQKKSAIFVPANRHRFKGKKVKAKKEEKDD